MLIFSKGTSVMYIVEGNIGAGKSTFLQLLETYMPHVSVSLEPVSDWQQHHYGQSLLHSFYQEPKRWGYTFETLTLMSRVKSHISIQQHDHTAIQLFERSIYSGHYCFAQNSYEQGFLQDFEWHMYHEWFNFLSSRCTPPHGFIYLKIDPAIAYERIKKRNRDAEQDIPLSYLEQIDQQHEQFLVHKKGLASHIANVPVLTLSCDADFVTHHDVLQEHIAKVQAFLKETSTKI